MSPTTARARDHQVVFCGLEVLRLIGERTESQADVDDADIRIILDFMRDVAHRCLENTEEIFRLAALDQRLDTHQRARALFDELGRVQGNDFATACRLYTDLLAQSIFEDRRCLATLDCDPVMLGQFYEWEREADALARPHGQILHRLEMKYTNPHCI
jgi:hypothetical protein